MTYINKIISYFEPILGIDFYILALVGVLLGFSFVYRFPRIYGVGMCAVVLMYFGWSYFFMFTYQASPMGAPKAHISGFECLSPEICTDIESYAEGRGAKAAKALIIADYEGDPRLVWTSSSIDIVRYVGIVILSMVVCFMAALVRTVFTYVGGGVSSQTEDSG